jgi:hypothetical protein
MAQEIAEHPVAIAAALAALRPLRAQIAQLARTVSRSFWLLAARRTTPMVWLWGRRPVVSAFVQVTASQCGPSPDQRMKSLFSAAAGVATSPPRRHRSEALT